MLIASGLPPLKMSKQEPLIYLDNAATTPVVTEVRERMLPWLTGDWGNPSSRHSLGVKARSAIDRARGQVAHAVGVQPARVVFTSGGTEANNMAVLGAARAHKQTGQHILIGPAEHPAVRDPAMALLDEGFTVEVGELASDGSFDVDAFLSKVRPDTVLVALMLASNEHGAIYPVARVAAGVRRIAPNAHIHCDAVQALGKLEVDVIDLGVDTVSISAHKIHGPKGTGALVFAGEARLRPLVFGGGQEGAVRSGTENVAGIIGFGEAVYLADRVLESTHAHLIALKQRLAVGLEQIGGMRVLKPGGEANSLGSIAAVLVSGPPAEVYLHHLEERGVLVSVGSACQAHKNEASPALLALGLSADEARQVLRFSFSRESTEAEVDRALSVLSELATELAPLA